MFEERTQPHVGNARGHRPTIVNSDIGAIRAIAAYA